jgi:hypothetical protein
MYGHVVYGQGYAAAGREWTDPPPGVIPDRSEIEKVGPFPLPKNRLKRVYPFGGTPEARKL